MTLTDVPIAELISIPVNAINNSNTTNAIQFLDNFLNQDSRFVNTLGDQNFSFKTISFNITLENGEQTQIEYPVILIIPFSLAEINSFDINMNIILQSNVNIVKGMVEQGIVKDKPNSSYKISISGSTNPPTSFLQLIENKFVALNNN